MDMRLKIMAAASLFALASACLPAKEAAMPAAVFDTATQQQLATNPLLAEWTGKYGGQPAFDKMDLAQVKPALEAGMAAHLAEIDAIANNPAKATFANTIEAM